jgi:hypothetical protein
VGRKEYKIDLTINDLRIKKLVIDDHYREKHSDISDDVIIELVKKLDQGSFRPVDQDEFGFSYFVNDKMALNGKTYKLIWLLKDGELFVGVINCYRRN